MHGTLRWIAAVAAAALGTAHATPTVTVADTPEGIEMRWAADETPLLMPRDVAYVGTVPNGLRPATRVEPTSDGFDLVLSYRNTFTTPRTTANVEIGPFVLGDRITWRDFRFTGAPETVSLAGVPASSHNYPGDLYSPVATLENDRFAIGLSFLYPVLDYEHQVNIALRTRTGKRARGIGGQGFFVRFDTAVNSRNPNQRRYPAILEPGEQREYRIAVRVVDKRQDDSSRWLKTLAPYARDFIQTHGPVQYQRDPRPVYAVVVAGDFLQSADNPYGFGRFRPDLNGWKPLFDWLRSRGGLERIMVWAPSGMHPSKQNNYPFHFATQLDRSPNLREAFDPAKGFPSLSAQGIEVGLWWGHAGWYLDRWDAPEKVGFDPNNPDHIAAAFAELRAAARAGATSIGMDAFSAHGIPLWIAHDWIQQLQSEFPDLRFVVEPKTCDILHNIVPMYYRAFEFDPNAKSADDLLLLDSPHFLADLLNPGHETWAALRWDRHQAILGVAASDSLMANDSAWAAKNGFVPLIHRDIPAQGRFRAQDSWLSSIPTKLHNELADLMSERIHCPYCKSDTICDKAKQRMKREGTQPLPAARGGSSTSPAQSGLNGSIATSERKAERGAAATGKGRSGISGGAGLPNAGPSNIVSRMRGNLRRSGPLNIVTTPKREQVRIVRVRPQRDED
mgnify:CR=1 FL=1